MIKDFRDLDVWKKGIEIILYVYKISELFPKGELYSLTSQMRRASTSIPANIAEGFNRKHNKEYKQFLYISLGSCAELETHLEVAFMLHYIKKNNKDDLLKMIQHESKMLSNLIKCIK